MKRNLLFVTYRDDDFDDGLSYALDLAKMTDRGVAILLVHKRKLTKKFEEIMSAVAFAEAGEHNMAREIMNESAAKEKDGDIRHQLEEKCNGSGVASSVYSEQNDTVEAMGDFLKKDKSIDMVLLSPSITDNGSMSTRELNKLLKTASMPIVTMAKHAHAAS
jgi:hypothetical protein